MLRIGISGWNYAGWRGDFYPDGLRHADELQYAAERLATIEVNGTFYSLKHPDDFEKWRDATPAGFRFAVKGSRYITHMLQLNEPRQGLANFLAQGLLRLGSKLGPILWQFPARMRFDERRASLFDAFLGMLPTDTDGAARLAREHGPQVPDPWTETDANHRLRHAVEVRHESFFCDEFVRLLRRHGVALVASDAADWPYAEEPTAGFLYFRMHGSGRTYSSRYSDAELDALARRITAWGEGREPDGAARIAELEPPRRKTRDVYVYFDNDRKVHAPRDALRLAERVGVEWE